MHFVCIFFANIHFVLWFDQMQSTLKRSKLKVAHSLTSNTFFLTSSAIFVDIFLRYSQTDREDAEEKRKSATTAMEKSKFSRYVIDESKQHKSSLAIQIVYSNQVFKYVFLTNDNFQPRFISLEDFPIPIDFVASDSGKRFGWSAAFRFLSFTLQIAHSSYSHLHFGSEFPCNFNKSSHTCRTIQFVSWAIFRHSFSQIKSLFEVNESNLPFDKTSAPILSICQSRCFSSIESIFILIFESTI